MIFAKTASFITLIFKAMAQYGDLQVNDTMGNITVAILGALDYGSSLGKKGTSTDITFYNLKKGEDTVTLIEPTRYPERLAPLFYAVSLSKKAIVVVDQIDATFGECLVMLQCADIKSGYIILRNYIPKEKICRS